MSDTSNQQDTQQEAQQDTGDQSQSQPEGQDFASNNNQDNNQSSENANESTAKKHTKGIENPDAIPSAGGKVIGEDHKGESKMLGENARSESVIAGGDADVIQKQLEGKKVNKDGGDAGNDGGEEKKGMVEKAKEKLGMGGH